MYSSTLPLASALDWGGWSTLRLGSFTPGKDPAPIVEEAGWAPGPVWTGAENLAPIGIRSPYLQPVASRYSDITTKSSPDYSLFFFPVEFFKLCHTLPENVGSLFIHLKPETKVSV